MSAIILGATGWSTYILFQQKKAWRQYAKIRGLDYDHGTTFGPCSMEGTQGDYTLSFFTAVQQYEDERKNRQLTVMQVTANVPFIDGVAMGTKEMFPFLRTLDAITPHDVQSKKWNKKNAIRSRNKKAVNTYLDEERIEVLTQILSMPNSDVLIVLDGEQGVFRFETSNPLKNAKQIHNVVNKLIARIKTLQPSEEESARLRNMKSGDDENVISPDLTAQKPLDEVSQLAGGLELEEEETQEIKEIAKEVKIENVKDLINKKQDDS